MKLLSVLSAQCSVVACLLTCLPVCLSITPRVRIFQQHPKINLPRRLLAQHTLWPPSALRRSFHPPHCYTLVLNLGSWAGLSFVLSSFSAPAPSLIS